MKRSHWLYLLLAFWVVVAGASAALNRLTSRWNDGYANICVNLQTSLNDFDALKKEEEKYGSLNRNSEQYRRYHTLWKDRVKVYNNRQAVEDVLKSITTTQKLVMAEPSEKNRVIENNPNNFRVEWHMIGSPASIVAWIADLEARIDSVVIEAVEWRSRADQQVDVAIEAVIKLPEA